MPLFFTDEAYPFRLKQCADAPMMLFMKGAEACCLNAKKIISVVGTRSASDYGKAMTETIVKGLSHLDDLLVVSGDIGGAYMGLQVLARENEVFKANPQHQPDLEPYSYLVERQLKPEARKDVVQLLHDLKVQPTSMIDISDGLSSELMHLCKQSGIGCRVYENKIPLDPQLISVCEEFTLDSTTIALSGGEDYELLFTVKPSDFDSIKGNPNLTVIGHMTAKGDVPSLVTRAEEVIPLKAQGWKAF